MLLKLILCVLLYFYLCENQFERYTLSEDICKVRTVLGLRLEVCIVTFMVMVGVVDLAVTVRSWGLGNALCE